MTTYSYLDGDGNEHALDVIYEHINLTNFYMAIRTADKKLVCFHRHKLITLSTLSETLVSASPDANAGTQSQFVRTGSEERPTLSRELVPQNKP